MTDERSVHSVNGWPVLGLLILAAGGIAWMYYIAGTSTPTPPHAWWLTAAIVATVVWVILLAGFYTLQPNVAAVLLLFGDYCGTARRPGLRWTNPFYMVKKVSCRAHNLNGDRLKVNDARGNPIEIAAVVVWRVRDTAQAVFDVEDYHEYVEVQSESAVRHLASRYPYDTGEDSAELSLRGSLDEVSEALTLELSERLEKAGVIVEEARISHLAYASEIAGAMLRRQQAEAIVAARQRIVDGAVGMVEMALEKLDAHHALKLDEERKAAMVGNLMVVLCGEREATPVINTGSLYS